MPEGKRVFNIQPVADELPAIKDLPKYTKKQLAEYIYELYIETNITSREHGVGKDVWVNRMLKGGGGVPPATKDELVRQLGRLLDERNTDINFINGLVQSDELLLADVKLAHNFSRNVLETELDARDDTSIPDERNASLSGFSTKTISDVVKNYRAYRRPYAMQVAQSMTAFYDDRNAINYRGLVEQVIETEYENKPRYMDGVLYERLHSYFARQKEQELEDLDERQYKALYQVHLEGRSILEDLGQEYNANFEGSIMSDDDVQRLIEQYTYTYYSDILIDHNEPNQDDKLNAYVEEGLKEIKWLNGKVSGFTEDEISDLSNDLKEWFEGSVFDGSNGDFDEWYDEFTETTLLPLLNNRLAENVQENIDKPYLQQTKYGSPIHKIAEISEGSYIAVINNYEQKEVAFPEGYPASYLIAFGYNPSTGEFDNAAYGFETYEEARDYYNEHYGLDIGASALPEMSDNERRVATTQAIHKEIGGGSSEAEGTAEQLLNKPLYGLVYNWKGLKEENTIYTSEQLLAEDPNFKPELEVQDGAFAANKTYIVYKLSGATVEETAANVKAFLTGNKNDTFDGAEIPDGWYWETLDTNLFTGEHNSTASMLIKHFNLTNENLRMQEQAELSDKEQFIIAWKNTPEIERRAVMDELLHAERMGFINDETNAKQRLEWVRELEAQEAPTTQKQTQKQNIKSILGKYNADELQKFISKELEENALKNEQSERQFIEFLASFKSSRYSARNQLMLYVQAYVNEYIPIFGTFDEWKEKGTSIQPGTHGLTICRPIFSDVYYKTREVDGKQVKDRYVKFALNKEDIERLEAGIKEGTVTKEIELTSFVYTDSAFSMSQTTMTEEQRIEYLQRYNALNTSTENAALYDKLKEISSVLGRPVEEQPIMSEALGWVERSDDGKIVIKADMPIDAKVSVLAHEIGHKLLHIQNSTADNRAQKEVQAQLFSHLAMLKLGIDAEKQFSLSYINNWIKASNKYPPVFDENGRELSKGEVLQINLFTVIPAVDALMKAVGEKDQPINKEELQALKDFNAEKKPLTQKKIEKQNKVEIEPLRVLKETEKAAMVKLPGASPEDPKKFVWLPKSQISINKDGFVYEATPSIIKDKGLTPKAVLTSTKGIIPQRSIKI
jgi:hypothetical protein